MKWKAYCCAARNSKKLEGYSCPRIPVSSRELFARDRTHCHVREVIHFACGG